METPTTLTTLLRHVAAKFPSRRAISVAAKFDLTHSRLHRLVESAAAQLVSAGVKPGDVVALTFPNTIEVRSLSPSKIGRVMWEKLASPSMVEVP